MYKTERSQNRSEQFSTSKRSPEDITVRIEISSKHVLVGYGQVHSTVLTTVKSISGAKEDDERMRQATEYHLLGFNFVNSVEILFMLQSDSEF